MSLVAAAIISTTIISCNNSKKESNAPEPAQQEILNYSKFSKGNGMVDSTLVNLVIKDNNVEGKMLWLPDGKDAKVGILHGTKNENGDLNLIFEHFQEGIKSNDSMVIKITSNQMIIKDVWGINPDTKIKTSTPDARDTLEKNAVDVIPKQWNQRLERIFNK